MNDPKPPAVLPSAPEPQEKELIERLAAWDHSAWAGWMRHLFSKCWLRDGTATIPSEWRARWERQMNTLYADLSEAEKESDRAEARQILHVLSNTDVAASREAEQTHQQSDLKGVMSSASDELSMSNLPIAADSSAHDGVTHPSENTSRGEAEQTPPPEKERNDRATRLARGFAQEWLRPDDPGKATFRSSLARMAPSSVIRDGVLFVALKCYFDGSEARGRFLSFAGVAADEYVWSAFEPAWDEVLKAHGARYSHMKELVALTGEFAGWDERRRASLLQGLEFVLTDFRSNPRIYRATCSVDLLSHDKWKLVHAHPEPARICARIVVPYMVDSYALAFEGQFIDMVDLWFDQGEPFMGHIADDWNSKKYKRDHHVWMLIRTIAPADHEKVIPLQVADVFAWSRNRIETSEPGTMDDFTAFAYRVTNASLRGEHFSVGDLLLLPSLLKR